MYTLSILSWVYTYLYIGNTDAVGKNENIMIYAPSNKGA